MAKLSKKHPIVIALKKGKVSKELSIAFCKFLLSFPDWFKQAEYLLIDKKVPIEEIITDLYDIPIKEQLNWKNPIEVEKKEEEEEEDFIIQKIDPSIPPSEANFLSLFKDWKQEHGFESIPIEYGDIHTFIRFEMMVTEDQEIKFIWYFNRSRYGKKNWGAEKAINISENLLDNNNNPGWVVKTFLEENKLLTDINHNFRDGKEIPNPLILSSRDTHSLIWLLLGHPFLFYKDSNKCITNTNIKVQFNLNVYSYLNHKIIAGIFYSFKDDGQKIPIITESFIDNDGFILYGKPIVVIYNSRLYEIMPTTVSSKMIESSLNGILISNDEWDEFLSIWNDWYQEEIMNIINPEITENPDFSARKIHNWRYWLIKPENKIQLFEKEEEIVKVYLCEETKNIKLNKLSIKIENFDPENNHLFHPGQCPRTLKLFHILNSIVQGKGDDECYYFERHSASQLLILLEEYPYAFNYQNKSIFSKSKLDFRITVKKNPENSQQYLLQGEICNNSDPEKWIPLFKNKSSEIKSIGVVPSYLLYKDQLARIGSMKSARLINDTLNGVIIEEKEISDFYATALPYLHQRGFKINDPQGLLRVSALYNYRLEGVVTIWEVHGILMGRLESFMHTDIGDFEYPINLEVDEFEQKLDQRIYRVPKDLAQEKLLFEELFSHGWEDEGEGEYSMREEITKGFILNILNQEHESNYRITYVGAQKLHRWKAKNVIPSISTKINSNVDWFDVNLELTIDGELLDLKELIRVWKQGEESIDLKEKAGIAVIDKEWLSKYAPIINKLVENMDHNRSSNSDVQEESETMIIEKYQVGLLSELESASDITECNDDWYDLIEKISNFKGIVKQKIPNTIKATLRDYQKEGVNWLCFLRQYNFGGILADDMGLGKTLQTLAFLAIEKKKKINLPNLVIAPTSVVTNWRAEAHKFIPSFNIVLLHGSGREEKFEIAKKSDLIITSYTLLQRDLEYLSAIKYNVVILDEAQMIKNARSKTAIAVTTLKANHRITLTGTPIENSVVELWSQFNFLMPGFLGLLKDFEKNYLSAPRKKKNNINNLSTLRRQTKPFILRRLKQDVAKELPEKTEQIIYCEMGEQQKRLYDSIMEICRQQIKEQIKINGLKGVKITMFDSLLKLRQICCDPKLSSIAGSNPPSSAKMELFIETLSNIVEEGHRVLVFSQFVKMLNLMHEPLRKYQIPFLQLDGSTKNRDEIVKKFQERDAFPVFLISLKAGGTGINLTAADYVIHYDPWWNPAVESQATDRAYRIGQKNHLFVYKLITRGTIEEKIVELQEKKRALANKIVGVSDDIDDMLDLDDLKDLLSI